MGTKEPSLYPEIERALKAVYNMHTIKVPGSTYNQGIPDFVLPQHCVEVKVQRKGGKKAIATALQQTHLDAVARKGGDGFTLVFIEETKEWYAVTSKGKTATFPRHQLPELLASVRDLD